MPLTTRCSHCGRLFPVSAQQIKQDRGEIDCPQCGKRFDLIDGLQDETTPAEEYGQDEPETRADPESAVATPADMLELDEGRNRGRPMRATLWSLGVLLLVTGIVLQIGWWDRGKWIQHPGIRATVERTCTRIGCRLEMPRLAGTMAIEQPGLSERGNGPDKLRLTLKLVNKSAIVQRLPQLQLELYDDRGEFTAARRFGPEEYLADPRSRRALAPGALLRPTIDFESQAPAARFRVKLF